MITKEDIDALDDDLVWRQHFETAIKDDNERLRDQVVALNRRCDTFLKMIDEQTAEVARLWELLANQKPGA